MWDDYFMSVAFLSAMRSKDPSTQVGACIVNPDNRSVLCNKFMVNPLTCYRRGATTTNNNNNNDDDDDGDPLTS